MKVHEAVAQALRDQDVEVVFGLIGDGNLYLVEDFRRRGGRYVPLVNEASVVLAAAGYCRTAGRLGVGTVTHGPGLTNTVTALVEAVKARTPVLLVAGDTAVADIDNFQDIHQRDFVVACGAGFVQARAPELIQEDVARAVRAAVIERRPVVLNIPIEFQWSEVDYRRQPEVRRTYDALGPDPVRIEEAVGVLAASRRPLVLAGRGAVAARAELLRLAERLGAPVATTAQARQLFRGERFDLGIFGGLATEAATQVVARADCLLAFGASLNRWTTADGALLNGRHVIHVDADAAALSRVPQPTVAVHGDAARSAEAIVAMLDLAEVPARRFAADAANGLADGTGRRAGDVARRRERELARERDGARPAGTVDLALAVAAVEEELPANRTLVIDAGRQMYEALAVLTVMHPDAYVHTTHFGAIGVGMPYAIGAAVGAPARPTLLVCGDGGFMLGGLVELRTAVREGLDLTVVVMNDCSYGAEHIQLVRKGIDPTVSMLDWPDLGPVAESLGAGGVTVRTVDELDAALSSLPQRAGTVVVDVHTSADEISAAG